LGRVVGANAMVMNQLAGPPTPASPGHVAEYYIHKQMETLGYVLQDVERDADYEAGKKVLARGVGLYKNVAEYDAKAMYPSLMAQDGIDPTSVRECSNGYEVKTSKGSKRICFDGGPIHEVFKAFLEGRDVAKAISKTADQAMKILANSAYGIFGKSGIGIVNVWVAAYIAQKTLAIIEDLRRLYNPVYSDTDSLYVELDGRDPETLLNEINAYVANRWRGPFGAKLVLKLEGVWEYFLIPPGKTRDVVKKNYIKVSGDEIVAKGNVLRPRDLPAHLRYGEYFNWVRALLRGQAKLADLLAQLEGLPPEELMVERSVKLIDLFFVRSKKRKKDGKPEPRVRPIRDFDHNRLPVVAYLAAKYGGFDAFIERDVELNIDGLSLANIITVYYLPLSAKGKRKEYIVLLGDKPHYVAFKASVERIAVDGRTVVHATAVREAMREVPREELLKIVKAKVLDHPIFRYFAQARLVG